METIVNDGFSPSLVSLTSLPLLALITLASEKKEGL
jgi:hypothetical protein